VIRSLGLAGLVLWAAVASAAADDKTYDVVVYGGTSGGIVAAISAAREGATVVVLEPTEHLGGMVTGGLGRTDLGFEESIGGMAAEFYRRVYRHYSDPAAWKFQTRDEYLNTGTLNVSATSYKELRYLKTGDLTINGDKWWFPEPSAASSIYRQMLDEAHVRVLTGHRLAGVEKRGPRIVSIRCANGAVFSGRVFIDTTYEGDLLAAAGVSYRVGRESRAEYGEKLAGVVPRELSTRKQFDVDISPYGDDGKLLYGVQDTPRGEDGAADRKIQAYNFRICLTDYPANRVAIEQPEHYDPHRYDLLARYIAAKPDIELATPDPNKWGVLKFDQLPNHKTDINDGGPFSTDLLGGGWDYPDGDEATRRAIEQEHIAYTKGLLYFLGHDERVPARMRQEMLRWGYPKDEYTSNGNWSPQLYIREARRMVGAYVMTYDDIVTKRAKDDSIGLASHKPDSHLVTRIADHGVARNEGNPNDLTPTHRPYEVPYRAITPKQAECDNLLVTFALSASHMAYASLRMEPAFMILSESAGLAAVEAARRDLAVQDVPYASLAPKLRERKQLLKIEDVPPPTRQ
jgi:flavin-dependent dehydrogenase